VGRRGAYEFPRQLKKSAIEKWQKEHPDSDEAIDCDHIIAIWFCKKYNIPPELANSENNLQVLTVKQHREKHRNEPTDEEYAILAQALLGFSY